MDPEHQRDMWLGITDWGALWVLNVRESNEITEARGVGKDKQTTHSRAQGPAQEKETSPLSTASVIERAEVSLWWADS